MMKLIDAEIFEHLHTGDDGDDCWFLSVQLYLVKCQPL